LRVRSVGDAHVDAELLHGRVEEFLQCRPEPVDFVDEEDVAGLEGREHSHEITGAFEHRPGGRPNVNAKLARHQQGQRRLAEAGRAEEQRVIERFLALFGGVDRDLQRFLHLRLPHEFVEPRRPQRRVGQPLILERLGGGYFRASHESDPRLFGSAFHRTGRVSASMMCGV
jgi:hypothetical protein